MSSRAQKRRELNGKNRVKTIDKRRKIDKVAENVRNAVISQKEISCIVYVTDSSRDFSGGILGDPIEVAEALVKAAMENKALYVILDAVVKTVDEKGIWKETKEKMVVVHKGEGTGRSTTLNTKIPIMVDEGLIDNKLYNILDMNGILFLEELKNYTSKTVKSWKNLGAKTFKALTDLMDERGIEFGSVDVYELKTEEDVEGTI